MSALCLMCGKSNAYIGMQGSLLQDSMPTKHPGGYNMQNIPYAKNIIFIKMTNYSKHEEYIAAPHMIR